MTEGYRQKKVCCTVWPPSTIVSVAALRIRESNEKMPRKQEDGSHVCKGNGEVTVFFFVLLCCVTVLSMWLHCQNGCLPLSLMSFALCFLFFFLRNCWFVIMICFGPWYCIPSFHQMRVRRNVECLKELGKVPA